MRDVILPLHIIAVAAWLGGNFVQLMLLPFFEKQGHEVAALWHEASGNMAKIYYTIAGVAILITGVVLVLDNDSIEFSAAYVSLGFLAVILGAAGGMAFFGPKSREFIAAHQAGDDAAIAGLRTKFSVMALIDTAIVILTIFAMVGRWGA